MLFNVIERTTRGMSHVVRTVYASMARSTSSSLNNVEKHAYAYCMAQYGMCSMSGHPACPGREWVARDGQRPHECSGRAVSSLTGPATTPCWSMTVYGVRVWSVMEQAERCCRYTDTAPCCSDFRWRHSVTSTECRRQQSEWCGAIVVYLQHRLCRFCAE